MRLTPKPRPPGLPTEVHTRCKKVAPHPAMRALYLKHLLSLNLITLVIFNFVCNKILVNTEQFLLSVSTLNVLSMLSFLFNKRKRFVEIEDRIIRFVYASFTSSYFPHPSGRFPSFLPMSDLLHFLQTHPMQMPVCTAAKKDLNSANDTE
jgi:hypothetical protein